MMKLNSKQRFVSLTAVSVSNLIAFLKKAAKKKGLDVQERQKAIEQVGMLEEKLQAAQQGKVSLSQTVVLSSLKILTTFLTDEGLVKILLGLLRGSAK